MKITIPPSTVFTGEPKPEKLQQIDALASAITQITSEYQLLSGWPEPLRSEQRKTTAENLRSVAEQLLALASEFADSGQQQPGTGAPEQ